MAGSSFGGALENDGRTHVKKPHEILYAIATAPERRRRLLTPVGLLIFTGLLLLVVFGSLFTDRALGLPRLLPGAAGSLIGLFLLAVGLPLWAWCVMVFRSARGTPVPFNPPRELVVAGPYAWMRNPMTIGVFASAFGVGFLLHSLSMVGVWTPVAFVVHAIAVKRLEEPELELRFGSSYTDYKRRVPMFIPRAPGRRTKGEIADLFPVFVPASFFEPGNWPGPYESLGIPGLGLTWAVLQSHQTMIYIDHLVQKHWEGEGIPWRERAVENVQRQSLPNIWTHEFPREDGSLFAVVMMHPDGVGPSRLLLRESLERLFPEGYLVALPEMSCGVAVSKTATGAELAKMKGVVDNCFQNGTRPLVPGMHEASALVRNPSP